VYDEDRDHKRDFLGKLNIPLWKIQNDEQVWYKLQNRHLAKSARGNNPRILLEMNLVWNQVSKIGIQKRWFGREFSIMLN